MTGSDSHRLTDSQIIKRGALLTATILLALSSAVCAASQADDAAALGRLEETVAGSLQERVLDPIVGRGRAFAFVTLGVAVRRSSESRDRSGEGSTKRKDSGYDGEQSARQARASDSERVDLSAAFSRAHVLVLYDDRLSGGRLAAAREALDAVLGPKMAKGKLPQISFQAIETPHGSTAHL